MKLLLNPDYNDLKPFLTSLPEKFDSIGELIYDKRNQVRVVSVNDRILVIKKFGVRKKKKFSFGKSKAFRAYNVGIKLLERGISTPLPVAAISFTIQSDYFISEYAQARPAADLLRRPDFDRSLAESLARFLYMLHTKGVWHADLNLSNIMVTDSDDIEKKFLLIDTNRTRFTIPGESCSIQKIAANLMRVTHRRDLMKAILSRYIRLSGQRDIYREVFRRLLRFEHSKTIRHSLARRLHLRP